jgi:hypothetical protein
MLRERPAADGGAAAKQHADTDPAPRRAATGIAAAAADSGPRANRAKIRRDARRSGCASPGRSLRSPATRHLQMTANRHRIQSQAMPGGQAHLLARV